MEQVMMDLGRVTDQELIAQLRHLVRADRTLSARLLVHLGEVDARGLFSSCITAIRSREAVRPRQPT
jgi:hypothetical protein